MADPRVEELFARLKVNQQQGYQHPSVSSPLMSPPAHTPNPVHSADILSPVNPSSGVGTPGQDTNRTNNLLNLLKFNNQPNPGPLANMQNVGSKSPAMPTASRTVSTTSNQDFLLNLLKKPAASRTPSSSELPPPSQPAAEISRGTTPVKQFGSPDVGRTSFEAPQPNKPSLFSYVNPFDQLHSSSPLQRTPNPDIQYEKKMDDLKHNRDVSTTLNGAAPAAKTRKLTSEDTASSQMAEVESNSQSVSKTLEGVGEAVDKQVEKALADAEQKSEKPPAPIVSKASTKKTQADNEDVDSSWESAEDSANDKSGEFNVKVYNFPMKPFVTIQIKDGPEAAIPVRQDNFMLVATLKKEFDQIDRCLATASQSYIVYAQTAHKKDNHGFRVIRQDSGDHKQVFRSSGERVFNVQLCSSPLPAHDVETVLGTGVNGSVFWTSLAKSRVDLFQDDDVESQGFIMPPVATAEENTSGSPVKTRVKTSSRHPEYFGLARGKLIHIVAPDTVKDKAYCNPKTRKINSEKFLAEHGLRINTGKAGKDFCFSEDDSVIVSLDKSGRVKFWDIRELTERACDTTEGKHSPVELVEPLWSMNTAASGSKADEKPSVSSIMLLDKERPYNKGLQLRYMLVGFKQNHILQLWDLGLGKAVQEIRLPHEKDSDGICSIGYHPKTGILAVGHPTRNSIYFIHLSAPRYALPAMDQAKFVSQLARNDPSLPRPESTAIMSGLREFSFNNVGQLRSIDMLKTPVDNAGEKGGEDETLFELYVMHSKGVVGISIKRADLGWDKDGKMLNPVDGVAVGAVEVGELKPIQPKEPANPSIASDTPTKKPEKKENKKETPKPVKIEIAKKETTSSPAVNGSQRGPESTPVQSSNPPFMTPDSYSLASQRTKSPVKDTPVSEKQSIATAVASMDTGALSKHFDSLYQRLDADKRVVEAAGAAKQDAMLRLVSSTLTENVEQSLHRIIGASIDQQVIPTLNNSTSKAIDQKLSDSLPQQVSASVQREIKTALPAAIQQALKDPQVQRTIADATAKQVQQQVSTLLQQSLPNMATQASQRMVTELEQRTTQQLRQAETQRQQDNTKIEELSTLVRSLTMTVKDMAESQTAFQQQILNMQRERSKAGGSDENNATSSTASTINVPEVVAAGAPEDEEINKITEMLMAGDYEEATLQWLQSSRQADLFDRLFVRVNPQYLQHLTPLVALSVSAAVTASFESNIDQRLDWLASVLSQIDVKDQDIMDVAPKIMDVLEQRLQGTYMEISETNSNSPVLRKISNISRQINEVRRMTG